MDTLTIIYLIFTFLGFYYFFLFTLIYFQNKSKMFEWHKPKKEYSLSIVVPCFNEEKSIEQTIKGILNSDYKGLKKLYVVDDCSTDKSYEIIKKCSLKYPQVIALQTPKNTGCAAGAKNYGAKFVDTELIGFSDADSYSNPSAISKMIGFFNDEKVGAVTSRVLVQNRKKFLAKLQSIEYKLIAFTRKLFGFVESIYVTNGPLSIYRKKAFDQVKGFDESNWTEDIEITWHFVSKGWRIHISLDTFVYTTVPEKFKAWIKQRLRWNIGGIQTIIKYRKLMFKCGMLGIFILPYFFLAWVLGIGGLLLFIYRFARYLYINYLATSYSIESQTAILRFNDIGFAPSVLFFFGMVLLTLGIWYNLTALSHSKKEEGFKKEGLFSLLIYMFVYLLFYPVVLVASLNKFFKGNHTWR